MKTPEIAIKLAMCPRCEARPGARCTTVDGRTTHTHTARTKAIDEGWRDGFTDGTRDALSLIRRYTERAADTANPTRDPYDLVLERIKLAGVQFGVA